MSAASKRGEVTDPAHAAVRSFPAEESPSIGAAPCAEPRADLDVHGGIGCTGHMWASGKADRALAGDDRAGWSARTSVRVRHRAVLRQRWRFLALFGAAMLAAVIVASLFATGPLQRGFILGSGITVVFGMVGAFVVLLSGSAPLMMGELAEQWTAQELRPLSRHGWRLVNHFGLGYGDQDHVLVRPGGVVLLETKWSGTPWSLDDRDYYFRRGFEADLGQRSAVAEVGGCAALRAADGRAGPGAVGARFGQDRRHPDTPAQWSSCGAGQAAQGLDVASRRWPAQ